MLKSLIKKQILEFTSFFTQGKNGKRRKSGAIFGFVVLMLYGVGAMCATFGLLAYSLCAPLVEAGQGWVYFAFMGVMATAFGIIGGVFMAKSSLYEAKDNELLFSMPIPAWAILFTRTAGLYLFTLLFEACAFVPALVVYMLVTGFSFAVALSGLLITLVLPLFAVAICCLLGFLLAWVTAKLPFKNLFIVLGFLVFMVGYSIVYSKVNEYLGYVITHGEQVGGVMQTWLFPFAQLGYAATGKFIPLLPFIGIFVGIFAIIYWILSATYFHIATMKKGEYRAKYKEKATRSASPQLALFKKEFWRLIKTPVYLLNAGMGAMMMLIVAAMMGIYGDFFGVNADMVASSPILAETIGLIVAVVVCFMASSNTIAACSVSLEGTGISLVQSMPLPEWTILKAKLYLHIAFTAIPDVILGLIMGLILKLEWFMLVGVVLSALIGSVLFAAMGLFFNLKFPHLQWPSEVVAVKQGMSVMFALFGGWGVCLLPFGAYFLFGAYLPAPLYLYLWLFVFALAAVLLIVWLKKRGTEIFKNLSA